MSSNEVYSSFLHKNGIFVPFAAQSLVIMKVDRGSFGTFMITD